MKLHATPLLLALALPGLTSCGKTAEGAAGQTDPVSPIVGTWTLDAEATAAAAGPDQAAQAAEMLSGTSVSVAFTEDGNLTGSMTMTVFDKATTVEFGGTWTLEGETVTMTTTTVGTEGSEEVKQGTLDGDRLHVEDKLMPMVLKR